MWTEAGVPRRMRLGIGLLLALGAAGCQTRPGSSPAPAKVQRPAPPEQKDSADEVYCRSPQSLRVLGPGPHGEPQVAQFVQCTPERLLIEMPAMAQAWLFVRDPQAPEQLSGFLLLHRRQAIVHYPSEQLALEGVARGWTQLLSRLASGVQAQEAGADPSKLRDPAQRFPDYRRWSFEDWQGAKHAPTTGHHHGPGGHHHGPGGHGHGSEEHHDGSGGHEHGSEEHHHGPGAHEHGSEEHHHGPDVHHHD